MNIVNSARPLKVSCEYRKNKEQLRRSAVHQAGHSVVGYLLPNIELNRHINIRYHKREEIYNDSEVWNHMLKQRIMIGMGGYVCEEIFYGHDGVSHESIMDYKHIKHFVDNKIPIGMRYSSTSGDDIFYECHDTVYGLLTENLHIVVGLIPLILRKETISAKSVNHMIKQLDLKDIFEA